MIRQAVESDFSIPPENECGIRIHSLKLAYGLDAPFIRYYSDDNGGLLSILDGAAIVSVSENIEEWAIFVTMNPEIIHLHCSAAIGHYLVTNGAWQGRGGVVLRYAGERAETSPLVCETPNLPSVHDLLCQCFDSMAPLNAWYPDVSHRIRHNCTKIATILDGEIIVSTAMTVAETDCSAILGQVATHSSYRGRGYAKLCINSLISRCKDKSLYILPMTDYAQSLYESMGFEACGDWAELQRI